MERDVPSVSLEMPGRLGLAEALDRLGRELASRGTFVELVVHEGGAAAFRFAWNLGGGLSVEVLDLAEDLAPAAAAAGADLGPAWLASAIGRGPADGTVFELAGTYPAGPAPGLRLLVADARYLRMMEVLSAGGSRA